MNMFRNLNPIPGPNVMFQTIIDANRLPTNDEIAYLFRLTGLSVYSLRDSYIDNFGFSIITQEVIEDLQKIIGSRKCLEVMGGTGFLSKCLKDAHVDIICTDDKSWANAEKRIYENWKKEKIDIVQLDALTAIDEYDTRDVIIMSWPPYMDSIDVEVLKKCIDGKKTLIYIGEDEGGCTGTDGFFEMIGDLTDKHKVRTNHYYAQNTPEYIDFNVRMPQFHGIHDQVFFFDFNV